MPIMMCNTSNTSIIKLMQVKYFETKNDDDDPGHFGGGGVVVFAWPTDCFDSHQSSSPQLGLADLPFA